MSGQKYVLTRLFKTPVSGRVLICGTLPTISTTVCMVLYSMHSTPMLSTYHLHTIQRGTENTTTPYFSNLYLKRYKYTLVIAKMGSSQAQYGVPIDKSDP